MNKKDRPTILILRKNNNNIKQILVNNIKQRWRKTWVTTSNITIKKRQRVIKQKDKHINNGKTKIIFLVKNNI